MHFGKIYTLGQRNMFEEQTKNILLMLDYGSSIDHKWLWKLGEPMEDGIETEKEVYKITYTTCSISNPLHVIR